MEKSDKSDHPSKRKVEIVDRPPVDERALRQLPEVEVVRTGDDEEEEREEEIMGGKKEEPAPLPSEKREAPPRRRLWPVTLSLIVVLLMGLIGWGWQENWFSPGPQLILTHNQKTWTLDLTRVGYDGERIESVDRQQLRAWLESVAQEVDRPPKNARMERWGEPIERSKPGTVLDVDMIEEEWLKQLEGVVDRPQPAPMVQVEPQVKEEDFHGVDQQEWARFTTWFDSAQEERTANIIRSAEVLDGRVINPGETVSFLGEVGEGSDYNAVVRTVDGTPHEIPGGGVSQTASTLFNTVDQISLEIIERHTYSDRDSYVAVGRDAFVRWGEGERDFRFRNSLNHPILIRTESGAGFITVSLYSNPEADPQIKVIPPALERVEPESDAFEPLPGEEPDTPEENNGSASEGKGGRDGSEQTGTPESRDPSGPGSPGNDRGGGDPDDGEDRDNEAGEQPNPPHPDPGDDDSEEEPEEPGGTPSPGNPPEEPPQEESSQEEGDEEDVA
ncbi:VanW family protein [Desmospora profundinema]|uniref:Vancomycin resistance protein YoaR n=1 Tax=Desmospora profundinema TaxID=1571184 RepID=A0ABU1IRK7_9BACL|nr:VanW family protein [Desmospora profundinema]MDR6227182.1 vancomycin resistance protein YoaR [Desmospora profundinema]